MADKSPTDRADFELEGRWETLVEYSSDIITVLDEQGIIRAQSPAFERLLGYDTDEVVGDLAFEYIHPEDVDRVATEFADLVTPPPGSMRRVEYRFRHAGGSWVWLETVGSDRTDTELGGYVCNSRDITERKRRERELETTRQQLAAILDNIESAVWMRNVESEYTLVNDEFRDLFGLEETEQLDGRALTELHGDDLGEQFRTNDQRALEAGEVAEFEEVVSVEDGVRHYLTQIVPLRDTQGEIYGTCGIATDITEQKERESVLRERNKELQALHRTTELFATRDAPAVDLLTELATCIPDWFQDPARTGVRITYDDIEVTAGGFDPSAETITTSTETIATSAETAQENTFELIVSHDADGNGHQFLPQEQDLVETIGTLATESLEHRSHELYQKLYGKAVEMADFGVMITDRDGSIEYVNPGFERQTGYAEEAAVGQTPRMLKSGRHDDEFYADLWKTILAGENWEGNLVNERKDGSLFYVEQVITPITDESGEITHFVAGQVDVTDRRIREQQLDVLNRILRHNLRNSLTVLTGHTTLLRDGLEDPALQHSLDTIERHVESLINTGEKTARVRQLIKHDVKTDSDTELTTVLETLRTTVFEEYPDVTVTVECPPSLRVTSGDWLRIALEETVQNAIEHNHSEDRQVELSVRTPADVNGDFVEIRVLDNGPGMPPDQLRTIESEAELPLEHGSGIGLWIIHWIIRRLGGEVEITNRDPHGTCMILRVPSVSD